MRAAAAGRGGFTGLGSPGPAQVTHVRELAGAQIRKARWNPGGRTLELLLRIGGAGADGGVDVLLRYRNVNVLEPALPALAALIEDPSLVVRRSTLQGEAGAWRHRLELYPGEAPPAYGAAPGEVLVENAAAGEVLVENAAAGEVLVECAAVEAHESGVAGPDYLPGAPRFQILSC